MSSVGKVLCGRCEKTYNTISGLNFGPMCLPCAEEKARDNRFISVLVSVVCLLPVGVFISLGPMVLIMLVIPFGFWLMDFQDHELIREARSLSNSP